MVEYPTLPDGWRFLDQPEDVMQGDLYYVENHGWEPVDPSISPKDHIVIRKRPGTYTRS